MVIAVELVPWNDDGPVAQSFKLSRVLNDYLLLPDVHRRRRPGAGSLSDGIALARAEFLQVVIDGLLARVRDGEDARVVFQDAKRIGRPRDERRTAAMAFEVVRLIVRSHTVSGIAIDAVASAFEVDPKTVERACSKWIPFFGSVAFSAYIKDIERRAKIA